MKYKRNLQIKTINLKTVYSLDYDLNLDIYIQGNYNKNDEEIVEGLLILPGGGYQQVCFDREGEPIALSFLAQGFNCFVLNYRTNAIYPNPHNDLILAMHYINTHYKEFNIFNHGISLIGFSAGGHLAASYGYLYNEINKTYNFDEKLIRPYSIILGYPVIDCDLGEGSSITLDVLSGKDETLRQKLSCSKNIDKNYPPTYIWATKYDNYISYKNTLQFAKSLKKNKIYFKMHMYKLGEHGTSICSRCVYPKNYSRMKEFLSHRNWVFEAADFVYNLKK